MLHVAPSVANIMQSAVGRKMGIAGRFVLFSCVFAAFLVMFPDLLGGASTTVAIVAAVVITALVYRAFSLGQCASLIACFAYVFPCALLLLIGGGDVMRMLKVMTGSANVASLVAMVGPLVAGVTAFFVVKKLQGSRSS